MRKPWPWYSETRSSGGWFVKHNGDQHFLGKNPVGAAKPSKKAGRWNPPNEILTEFYRLMTVSDPGAKEDYSVETICALYLDELQTENPELAKRYQPTLTSFCKFKHNGKKIGKLLVNAELDAPHLTAWAKQFPSANTRRTYINCCKQAISWAVKRKRINILYNPLAGVSAPKGESAAVAILKEEHEALLNFFDDSFRDFLIAMWFTGARPGEIAKIEAHHCKNKLWQLSPKEHKTGRVTQKNRMIGVVGQLKKIVQRLCLQYPEGPIFRNSYGKAWTTGAAFQRFKKARKAGIIRSEVTPYSYRHDWATHALVTKKLSAYEVAKALGHQTTQMVYLHYDHSRESEDHIHKIFVDSKR